MNQLRILSIVVLADMHTTTIAAATSSIHILRKRSGHEAYAYKLSTKATPFPGSLRSRYYFTRSRDEAMARMKHVVRRLHSVFWKGCFLFTALMLARPFLLAIFFRRGLHGLCEASYVRPSASVASVFEPTCNTGVQGLDT